MPLTLKSIRTVAHWPHSCEVLSSPKSIIDFQTLQASRSLALPPTDLTGGNQQPVPSIYFEVRILESLNIPGSGVYIGFAAAQGPPRGVGMDVVSFGIGLEQGVSRETCVIHAGVKRPYGRVSLFV